MYSLKHTILARSLQDISGGSSRVCRSHLVEDAWRFQKIFDVTCTSYKILENARESLLALQHDCSMEFVKNSRCMLQKIYAFSMQHTKLLQFSVNNLCKTLFFKKNQLTIIFSIVSQNFPYSWEFFSCAVFLITCSQKLGCDYNLFNSRIFILSLRSFHLRQFSIIIQR